MSLPLEELVLLDSMTLANIVIQLSARIAEQDAQIKALEARLNKNSKNSSKPPSSDPPFRKIDSNRETNTKPSGGQSGHTGHGLKKVQTPDHAAATKLRLT